MTARKLHNNFCSPQVHRPRFFCAPATAPENSSLRSCVWPFIVILRFNLQLVFTNAPNILGRSKQANTPLRKKKLWQGVVQIPPREGNIRSCLGGIVSNAYSSKKSLKRTVCPCGKFIDDLKLLYVIPRKYLGLQFQDWRHISDWMQFGQKIRLRTSSGSVNKFRHKSGELSLILRWYRLAQTQLKHVKSPWPRPSSGRVSTKV